MQICISFTRAVTAEKSVRSRSEPRSFAGPIKLPKSCFKFLLGCVSRKVLFVSKIKERGTEINVTPKQLRSRVTTIIESAEIAFRRVETRNRNARQKIIGSSLRLAKFVSPMARRCEIGKATPDRRECDFIAESLIIAPEAARRILITPNPIYLFRPTSRSIKGGKGSSPAFGACRVPTLSSG